MEFRVMEFRVGDMTCDHCARHVTQAIQALDGSARVKVDLVKKLVTAETAAAAQAIKAALDAEGYPATIL